MEYTEDRIRRHAKVMLENIGKCSSCDACSRADMAVGIDLHCYDCPYGKCWDLTQSATRDAVISWLDTHSNSSRESVTDQLAEWTRIKELFRAEVARNGSMDTQYPGHRHDTPGIWGADSEANAGHECAACAATRAALETNADGTYTALGMARVLSNCVDHLYASCATTPEILAKLRQVQKFLEEEGAKSIEV